MFLGIFFRGLKGGKGILLLKPLCEFNLIPHKIVVEINELKTNPLLEILKDSIFLSILMIYFTTNWSKCMRGTVVCFVFTFRPRTIINGCTHIP
jgi:hypothetical protein